MPCGGLAGACLIRADLLHIHAAKPVEGSHASEFLEPVRIGRKLQWQLSEQDRFGGHEVTRMALRRAAA